MLWGWSWLSGMRLCIRRLGRAGRLLAVSCALGATHPRNRDAADSPVMSCVMVRAASVGSMSQTSRPSSCSLRTTSSVRSRSAPSRLTRSHIRPRLSADLDSLRRDPRTVVDHRARPKGEARPDQRRADEVDGPADLSGKLQRCAIALRRRTRATNVRGRATMPKALKQPFRLAFGEVTWMSSYL